MQIPMDDEIIIVSGLPRSGTSLMMQMLAKGGIEVLTDNIRTADTDNPRGYYEFERVKKIKEDASWVPEARGRPSRWSPSSSSTFRRTSVPGDLHGAAPRRDAHLAGEDARAAEPRDGPSRGHQAARSSSTSSSIRDWLLEQPHIKVLHVQYSNLVEHPETEARRVSEFLGGRADPQAMASAVDSSLYRNRKSEGA